MYEYYGHPYGYGNGYGVGYGYPPFRERSPYSIEHVQYHQMMHFAQSILMNAKSQKEAIHLYERMLQSAPEEHQADLKHILADEHMHLRLFTELYRRLTGTAPGYHVSQVQFTTYEEALQKAYEAELEAYETYRNQYLSTPDPSIRDILFRAMTDEIEHAVRFIRLMERK